jgi:radical SAM superfamily enzyme YgiQ (UPF0313 family)
MKNCKKLGIAVHGDFIIGLPGETPESIERTVKYAEELDCETIQVSIAHSYPGTELHDYFLSNDYHVNDAEMTDDMGHQLPAINYPGLSREEIDHSAQRIRRHKIKPKISPDLYWLPSSRRSLDTNAQIL